MANPFTQKTLADATDGLLDSLEHSPMGFSKTFQPSDDFIRQVADELGLTMEEARTTIADYHKALVDKNKK